jgi:hypothetical protein
MCLQLLPYANVNEILKVKKKKKQPNNTHFTLFLIIPYFFQQTV